MKNNLINKNNYQEYTDKYFLRSKEILQCDLINPYVRYQVFARENINPLKGIREATEFIKDVAGNKAKICALKDGEKYFAKEPIMKIEGYVQDLIDLETGCLEILSGNITGEINLEEAREKARAIVQSAEKKPVYYFGARHFHYALDEKIAKICQEEGFRGASTDIGARAWNSKGLGTTPHALILSYAAHLDELEINKNPTVEAARGFDAYMNFKIPRIILIDTFNREIDDSIETARALPTLQGVRIDTCGENYAQGAREIILPKMNVNPKYLNEKGVSIAGVWALRKALDRENLGDLEITVSSGFNAEKTKAFIEADKIYQKMYDKPLFDAIGTGSVAKPIMTTSDIVAYFNFKKQKWIPFSKKGRGETESKRLEEIK